MDTHISDLFFNHQHPNYDGLFIADCPAPSRSQIRDCLVEDAQDFAVAINGLLPFQRVTPDELVEDFLARV